MEYDVIAVHLAFAGMVFLLLSWLGRHSGLSGYMTLSLFIRRDEAPAFNLIFRAFGPIIFVVALASALYALNLDRYVNQIWLVILYYYVGRLVYIFGFNRFLLINWVREIALFAISVGIGWLLYEYVIREKRILLPDVEHINNYIWVLIALFVYAAFNDLRFGQESTARRKTTYLQNQFSKFKGRYSEIIAKLVPDKLAEALIYTILIYEDFNRPAAVRGLEHFVFPWMSKSLGPMQVATDRRLSDLESVQIGAQRIVVSYRDALESGQAKAMIKKKTFDPIQNSSHRNYVAYKISAAYNKDDDYVSGITELLGVVIEKFYPELMRVRQNRYDYLI